MHLASKDGLVPIIFECVFADSYFIFIEGFWELQCPQPTLGFAVAADLCAVILLHVLTEWNIHNFVIYVLHNWCLLISMKHNFNTRHQILFNLEK